MGNKQAFFKAIGKGVERAIVPDLRSKILAALGVAGTGGAGIYGYNSGFDTGKSEGFTEGKKEALDEVRNRISNVLLGAAKINAQGSTMKKASFMKEANKATALLRLLRTTGSKTSQYAKALRSMPFGSRIAPSKSMPKELRTAMRTAFGDAVNAAENGKLWEAFKRVTTGEAPLITGNNAKILERRLMAADRLAQRKGYRNAGDMYKAFRSGRIPRTPSTPAAGTPGFGTGLALGGGIGVPLAGGAAWLGNERGYEKGYNKGGNEALQAGLNFGHYLAQQQLAQNNDSFINRLGNLFSGNLSNLYVPDFSGLTFEDMLKMKNAQQ